MKAMAFDGGARKDGNTTIPVDHVFGELSKEGTDIESIQFSGKKN